MFAVPGEFQQEVSCNPVLYTDNTIKELEITFTVSCNVSSTLDSENAFVIIV